MDPLQLIILAIFIITLIVIISEKVDETAAVLFAMSISGIVLFFGMDLPFRDFVMLIEWDSILFIAAMLIVVSVAAASGMFQYIALILVKRTGGDPKSVFLSFMGFVFVMSLFLDPLPTMLVIGTFTVEVYRALDMDFRPLLISEVIVANFASIPTIVGSVPNLVIALWTNMDAALMFITLLPLALILFFVTVPILLWYFKDSWKEAEVEEDPLLFLLQPKIMIKSRHDFYLSIIAMATLITGFMIGPHHVTLVALAVASGMLVFSHERAKDLIRQLSWDTIFFLIGLFGLVAAVSVTGIVDLLVSGLSIIIGGNVFLAILLLIWIPGLALSIIDNIPVAALLAPMATEFGVLNRMVPMSLIIGTNIGGYIIPFGDAPNMIAVSLAEEHGRPISFMKFLKVAFPLGLLHLVISTVYSFIMAVVLA
ncbi:MAG: SLC13 family permease [Candidatus Thorarchaeota archaeon]